MFLVSTDIDTEREEVHELSDLDEVLDFVDAALMHPRLIPDGGAILIRRANYLDRPQPDRVVSERPKLTLIQGGKA